MRGSRLPAYSLPVLGCGECGNAMTWPRMRRAPHLGEWPVNPLLMRRIVCADCYLVLLTQDWEEAA